MKKNFEFFPNFFFLFFHENIYIFFTSTSLWKIQNFFRREFSEISIRSRLFLKSFVFRCYIQSNGLLFKKICQIEITIWKSLINPTFFGRNSLPQKIFLKITKKNSRKSLKQISGFLNKSFIKHFFFTRTWKKINIFRQKLLK